MSPETIQEHKDFKHFLLINSIEENDNDILDAMYSWERAKMLTNQYEKTIAPQLFQFKHLFKSVIAKEILVAKKLGPATYEQSQADNGGRGE